jgi:endo-1,4-beta-mannosidase
MMSQPFTLGVNYWPRRKAMYWWNDFDAGEVRDEFSLIRDLKLEMVRVFLLWDDWQPTPDTVSKDCLSHLVTVADIAADLGLKLDVTFFTGHMSGPNWSPQWLLEGKPLAKARQLVSGNKIVDRGYRNMFVDPVAIEAAKLQLSTVVNALYQHTGIGLWNLGNEPDLFAWPPTAAQGRAWVRDMVGLIKNIDPVHPVTIGLHAANLVEDNGLRINDAFAETDLAVMHTYPMYSKIARGPLDPDYVPFATALTSALCGKPTLMEEFGGCTALPGEPSYVKEWISYDQPRTQFMASEEDLAQYLETVLPKLVEVGSTGAMVWCFADYAEALWDRPPCLESWHERYFGLVRPDGSVKPHAEVMKRFAETNPTVQPAKRTVTLDVTPEEYYAAPVETMTRLYGEYIKKYEG